MPGGTLAATVSDGRRLVLVRRRWSRLAKLHVRRQLGRGTRRRPGTLPLKSGQMRVELHRDRRPCRPGRRVGLVRASAASLNGALSRTASTRSRSSRVTVGMFCCGCTGQVMVAGRASRTTCWPLIVAVPLTLISPVHGGGVVGGGDDQVRRASCCRPSTCGGQVTPAGRPSTVSVDVAVEAVAAAGEHGEVLVRRPGRRGTRRAGSRRPA